MEKVTIAIFADLLKIFPTGSTDLVVVEACLARNGFESGCCSDLIISAKTGLSHKCIQSSFARLKDRKIFVDTKRVQKERWGRICIEDYKNTYSSSLLDTSHTNNYHDVFTGTITKIDKEQSKIFLENNNNLSIAFCSDSSSLVFALTIGTEITFNGSLITQETGILMIYMEEKSVRIASSNINFN